MITRDVCVGERERRGMGSMEIGCVLDGIVEWRERRLRLGWMRVYRFLAA